MGFSLPGFPQIRNASHCYFRMWKLAVLAWSREFPARAFEQRVSSFTYLLILTTPFVYHLEFFSLNEPFSLLLQTVGLKTKQITLKHMSKPSCFTYFSIPPVAHQGYVDDENFSCFFPQKQ